MANISGKDTAPEMIVRKTIHKLGFRYRLHVDKLPGKPDLVLPRHRKVIFVHGCFWHGHEGCKRSKRPTTNKDFWNEKIERNIQRDNKAKQELEKLGWQVLAIWQCQTKNKEMLLSIITDFLHGSREHDCQKKERKG